MFAKLSEAKAASFVTPGDRVQSVISGKWSSGLLDPTKNLAAVAGLGVASLVSRDGENGWLIVTEQALLAIGASKVTGGPEHVFAIARRDTRLALTGGRHNRLSVLDMQLVVRKQDLATAQGLAPEPGAAPDPELGFVPTFARPGTIPTPAPTKVPVTDAAPPGSSGSSGGGAAPPGSSGSSGGGAAPPGPSATSPRSGRPGRPTWTPPPGAAPEPTEPIRGLQDLFDRPPPNPPAE